MTCSFKYECVVCDTTCHHVNFVIICVTNVPWCMSGSLTRGSGENVRGIPGVCTTRNFTYLVRGPWLSVKLSIMVGHAPQFIHVKRGVCICYGSYCIQYYISTKTGLLHKALGFCQQWYFSTLPTRNIVSLHVFLGTRWQQAQYYYLNRIIIGFPNGNENGVNKQRCHI